MAAGTVFSVQQFTGSITQAGYEGGAGVPLIIGGDNITVDVRSIKGPAGGDFTQIHLTGSGGGSGNVSTSDTLISTAVVVGGGGTSVNVIDSVTLTGAGVTDALTSTASKTMSVAASAGSLLLTGSDDVSVFAGDGLTLQAKGTGTTGKIIQLVGNKGGAAAQNALTVAHAGTATGDDLTISQTGGTDSSLILQSAGTGTDALKLSTSAGGMHVSSADDYFLTGSQTVAIRSVSDTANDAVQLVAQAGGILQTVADEKTWKAGGFNGTDAPNVYFAVEASATPANNKLEVENQVSTATDAISLTATAGGIATTVAAGKTFSLNPQEADTTSSGNVVDLQIGANVHQQTRQIAAASYASIGAIDELVVISGDNLLYTGGTWHISAYDTTYNSAMFATLVISWASAGSGDIRSTIGSSESRSWGTAGGIGADLSPGNLSLTVGTKTSNNDTLELSLTVAAGTIGNLQVTVTRILHAV